MRRAKVPIPGNRYSKLAAGLVIALVAAVGGIIVWHALAYPIGLPLNTAVLDDFTCGTNLQLGSDKTASTSAKPSFILHGDGAISSYQIFIDGTSIGTFADNGQSIGNVCIYAPNTLSEGPHQLTGNELSPKPANTVVPFNFSVDSIPPTVPSTPVLASFCAIPSATVTKFHSVTLVGTSQPGVSVQVFAGGAGLGGGVADSTGNWSAVTQNLANGNYAITAKTYDRAGNISPASGIFNLTIDDTAGATVPSAPTALTATPSSSAISLAWTASGSGGSALTGYNIYRSNSPGAETLLTSIGVTNSYLNSGLTNGQIYYYKLAAVNAIGASPLSAETSATAGSTSAKVGDINGDGNVNIFDLSILATYYGQAGQSSSTGDLNGDGNVNIFDLSILASHWGT